MDGRTKEDLPDTLLHRWEDTEQLKYTYCFELYSLNTRDVSKKNKIMNPSLVPFSFTGKKNNDFQVLA